MERDWSDRIASLVTLSTPHRGTALADYILAIFYTGNFDAPLSTFLKGASNNWYGMRNRNGPDARSGQNLAWRKGALSFMRSATNGLSLVKGRQAKEAKA